eukprot:gb/GECH01012762.1/.p1 GENE.gb/GECH01012762.1/~~gb/GECH01012762.1/.p1  ORF type:complete len:263 (+),score=66.95 gb/GECH01012762.1/:1-789(+)
MLRPRSHVQLSNRQILNNETSNSLFRSNKLPQQHRLASNITFTKEKSTHIESQPNPLNFERRPKNRKYTPKHKHGSGRKIPVENNIGSRKYRHQNHETIPHQATISKTFSRYKGRITAEDYLNKDIKVPYRYGATEEDLANTPIQIKRIFDWRNASQKEVLGKKAKEHALRFGKHNHDFGSAQVQIAVFTSKIDALKEHVADNHKDHDSKRYLDKLVHRRRKMMKYLRRKNFDVYWATINAIGIVDEGLTLSKQLSKTPKLQ